MLTMIRPRQGLIRFMGIASASLLSLALLASANANLQDDAGKSIWGGAVQPLCGGKNTQSIPYGCDYSKPPEQGGCPTDTYQASGTGNSCVSSSTTCRTCTCTYVPSCNGVVAVND